MKKTKPAADPTAYLRSLRGWRRECVEELRATVLRSAKLDERIKWGHLVYIANGCGPVLLIRAEEEDLDFLETQLETIRQIGLERYMAQHVHEE